MNGEDHLNDLLGVLNDEEKERYLRHTTDGSVQLKHDDCGYSNDHDGGGRATKIKGGTENFRVGGNNHDYERRDDHTPRRGYSNNTMNHGQDVASPRKMQQQQHVQQDDHPEVRVSVVTPQQQQRQDQNITNESPTSIFSILNCGDITSDISETLSLIFSSPTPVTNTKNPQQQKQQQREIQEVVPEDEEEEERILMKKLQRLREKKWRGRSPINSRTRART